MLHDPRDILAAGTAKKHLQVINMKIPETSSKSSPRALKWRPLMVTCLPYAFGREGVSHFYPMFIPDHLITGKRWTGGKPPAPSGWISGLNVIERLEMKAWALMSMARMLWHFLLRMEQSQLLALRNNTPVGKPKEGRQYHILTDPKMIMLHTVRDNEAKRADISRSYEYFTLGSILLLVKEYNPRRFNNATVFLPLSIGGNLYLKDKIEMFQLPEHF
ncbi:hypothetical protein HOY80DRAFT_1134918 [Tuber brumale]|nr:hypothetical protein HOY80DRAFT_1134918 [Tuber brumale]